MQWYTHTLLYLTQYLPTGQDVSQKMRYILGTSHDHEHIASVQSLPKKKNGARSTVRGLGPSANMVSVLLCGRGGAGRAREGRTMGELVGLEKEHGLE